MQIADVVLAVISWIGSLWLGVILKCWERGFWAFVAHTMSIIFLVGTLATIVHRLQWHIGWWVLAIVPAAVIINLIIIFIVGNIRPRCKACGSHKFEPKMCGPEHGPAQYWVCKICQTPKGER